MPLLKSTVEVFGSFILASTVRKEMHGAPCSVLIISELPNGSSHDFKCGILCFLMKN